MSTILCVEDELEIAELIERIVSRLGYMVRLARDAQEAFQLIKEQPPTLILLDITLGQAPATDGWEVQRLLKENPETTAIPVVALTARHPSAEDRARALAAGFAEHLSKPIEFPALRAVLAKFAPLGGT